MTDLLFANQYFCIALTLVVFAFTNALQQKYKYAILNPIILSALIIIGILSVLDVPNATYQAGCQILNYLLTPATICLAIGFYEQFQAMRSHMGAIFIGTVAGTICCLGTIYILCRFFGFGLGYFFGIGGLFGHIGGIIGELLKHLIGIFGLLGGRLFLGLSLGTGHFGRLFSLCFGIRFSLRLGLGLCFGFWLRFGFSLRLGLRLGRHLGLRLGLYSRLRLRRGLLGIFAFGGHGRRRGFRLQVFQEIVKIVLRQDTPAESGKSYRCAKRENFPQVLHMDSTP